jgi:hypothetical protein
VRSLIERRTQRKAKAATASQVARLEADFPSRKRHPPKVAFNIPTGVGRIWLNNCLKVTTQKEKNALWYFKFGNYHCDGAQTCWANFKNIHLHHKGSTDVKSPIP